MEFKDIVPVDGTFDRWKWNALRKRRQVVMKINQVLLFFFWLPISITIEGIGSGVGLEGITVVKQAWMSFSWLINISHLIILYLLSNSFFNRSKFLNEIQKKRFAEFSIFSCLMVSCSFLNLIGFQDESLLNNAAQVLGFVTSQLFCIAIIPHLGLASQSQIVSKLAIFVLWILFTAVKLVDQLGMYLTLLVALASVWFLLMLLPIKDYELLCQFNQANDQYLEFPGISGMNRVFMEDIFFVLKEVESSMLKQKIIYETQMISNLLTTEGSQALAKINEEEKLLQLLKNVTSPSVPDFIKIKDKFYFTKFCEEVFELFEQNAMTALPLFCFTMKPEITLQGSDELLKLIVFSLLFNSVSAHGSDTDGCSFLCSVNLEKTDEGLWELSVQTSELEECERNFKNSNRESLEPLGPMASFYAAAMIDQNYTDKPSSPMLHLVTKLVNKCLKTTLSIERPIYKEGLKITKISFGLENYNCSFPETSQPRQRKAVRKWALMPALMNSTKELKDIVEKLDILLIPKDIISSSTLLSRPKDFTEDLKNPEMHTGAKIDLSSFEALIVPFSLLKELQQVKENQTDALEVLRHFQGSIVVVWDKDYVDKTCIRQKFQLTVVDTISVRAPMLEFFRCVQKVIGQQWNRSVGTSTLSKLERTHVGMKDRWSLLVKDFHDIVKESFGDLVDLGVLERRLETIDKFKRSEAGVFKIPQSINWTEGDEVDQQIQKFNHKTELQIDKSLQKKQFLCSHFYRTAISRIKESMKEFIKGNEMETLGTVLGEYAILSCGCGLDRLNCWFAALQELVGVYLEIRKRQADQTELDSKNLDSDSECLSDDASEAISATVASSDIGSLGEKTPPSMPKKPVPARLLKAVSHLTSTSENSSKDADKMSAIIDIFVRAVAEMEFSILEECME